MGIEMKDGRPVNPVYDPMFVPTGMGEFKDAWSVANNTTAAIHKKHGSKRKAANRVAAKSRRRNRK